MRQGFTRERRRLGSVTPDETGDGIAGAEPQKIGSGIALGQNPKAMPVMANDCTPHRSPSEERRLLIRSVKSHKALLSPKVTKAFTEKIHFYSSGAQVRKEIQIGFNINASGQRK